MARIASVLFAVVLIVAAVATADPVAPSKPVEITTEAGSVAGTGGKAVVAVKAVVTKKAVTFTTSLESSGSFDFRQLDFDNDTLRAMISALEETLKNPDSEYTKEVGSVEVTNKEDDNKRVITIRQKTEGFSLNRPYLNFDTDNATTLVTILKKALSIQDWMKDKVAVFQGK